MAFGMGFGELVLILIIVVVVFGATKLPGMGEGLGPLLRGEHLPPPRPLLLQRQPRWTRADSAIAIAAVLLAVATVVLVATGR